tara:strand:+ start:442 stop:1590 length:1149 start_codon:yes stop_codon:yes gene_type:complete
MAETSLVVAAIGLILLVGVFLKFWSVQKGYPLTLLLLILGLIIGPILGWFRPAEFLGGVNPFITLALVMVLFDAGTGIKIRSLTRNFAKPTIFGVLGVLFTILLVALPFKFLLGLNWTLAVLFGSFLASTDLTILDPIFKNLKITPKEAEFIELESTLNSVLAAVFVVVLVNLLSSGSALSFDLTVLGAGFRTLLYNIFVGIGLGILFGYLILRFIRHLTLTQLPHIVMIGALFTAFALSELVGASGIATALAIGIVFGNSKVKLPKIIKSFGGEMELILVTFVYVILGAIIDFKIMTGALLFAGVLIALVYIARFVALKVSKLDKLKLSKFYLLSSPRGITCAVLTLSYANLFPNPSVIIGLVFSVVLVSSLSLFAIPRTV